MTTFETPIVAGVFDQETHAKEAVDDLRNVGFAYDQIGVAMQGGAPVDNLQNDLMNLGVPQEKASFYDGEFKAGHIVVSVRPDGREDEAKKILRDHGAHDFGENISPDR